MAKAAGGAGSGGGMERSELKRLLRLAREEPISAAVALGGDGKALVQLDRRKPGRALEKQIKDGAPDSKNHRWGTVAADANDPKTAVFQVNKAGGGMARKLVAALKGTGFSKVRLVLEDGTEAEAYEEEDETAGDGAHGAEAETGNAAAAPTAPAPADGPAAVQPGGDGSAPPPGQPDPKALTDTFTGLVRQVLDAIRRDPSRKAALTQLASAAQTSLKAGDLVQASAEVEALRQALEGAPAGAAGGQAAADAAAATAPGGDGQAAAPAAASANSAVFAKARTAWAATRKRVDGEVEKLRGAMESVYQGHGVAPHLDTFFKSKIDPMLDRLDEKLAGKLDEVMGNAEPARHAQLVQEAKQILQDYQSYVVGEPFIAELDANPFVPLAIGKTLTATLAALAKAVA